METTTISHKLELCKNNIEELTQKTLIDRYLSLKTKLVNCDSIMIDTYQGLAQGLLSALLHCSIVTIDCYSREWEQVSEISKRRKNGSIR